MRRQSDLDAWRELADTAGIAPRVARTRTLCELRAAAAAARVKRRRRAVLVVVAVVVALVVVASL